MASPIPTSTPRSTRGANPMVAKVVPAPTSAWGNEPHGRWVISFTSTRRTTTTITITPSTEVGRSSSRKASGSTASTKAPVIAPDQGLVAPAIRLSELRENEPPTGKAPDTAEARLATPWLTISRLAFQRRRSAAA